MNRIFLVGIGGFLGAILRYLINVLVQNTHFPYGTFIVNIVGCFLIGMAAYFFELQTTISTEIRLFFIVGFLGSFTTYSTFSNDSMNMLQNQKIYLALINISSHIIIGLLAVLAGRFALSLIWK